ncbi:unnamed protein product [Lathyrus oleraceus]
MVSGSNLYNSSLLSSSLIVQSLYHYDELTRFLRYLWLQHTMMNVLELFLYDLQVVIVSSDGKIRSDSQMSQLRVLRNVEKLPSFC